MKSLWIFRTNLRPLEYYHKFSKLEEFQQKCHDFYLLQGIWYLENNVFDEVVIWRLKPKNHSLSDIYYTVNDKPFIQKFVDNFEECFKLKPPAISFFRGGFPEYCKLTKANPKFFGLKLYLGAGRRTKPQYGGVYDKILVEDNQDFSVSKNSLPFYKTANPNIFRQLDIPYKYDICWPCNFEQLSYKGQRFFIQEIANSSYLKTLNILHIGNKPEEGKRLCQQYKVSNITFAGHVDRPTLNTYLNKSKFGLVTSNEKDGNPRVCTEILCSGTPLLIRQKTRLLTWYKKYGIIEFQDTQVPEMIKYAMDNFLFLRAYLHNNMIKTLSMSAICQANLELWSPK